MKTINVARLILTVYILGTLIFLPACQRSSIETNDKIIDYLQKDTHFPIVTPTYLPDGIHPTIAGVGAPTASNITNSTGLNFIYRGENDDIFIWVNQENIEVVPVPSGPSSIIIVNDIDILEETGTFLDYDKEILLYNWNKNGVFFSVYISGYDKMEARKVVESMVK